MVDEAADRTSVDENDCSHTFNVLNKNLMRSSSNCDIFVLNETFRRLAVLFPITFRRIYIHLLIMRPSSAEVELSQIPFVSEISSPSLIDPGLHQISYSHGVNSTDILTT